MMPDRPRLKDYELLDIVANHHLPGVRMMADELLERRRRELDAIPAHRDPDDVVMEGGVTHLPAEFREVARKANEAGLAGYMVEKVEIGIQPGGPWTTDDKGSELPHSSPPKNHSRRIQALREKTMSADFRVTINGPRGEEWERVAGTRTFPVLTPIPCMATLPGRPGLSRVFLVDLGELGPGVLERIVAHLAAKFQLSEQEAAAEIKTAGVPILDEECTVSISNPQKWLSSDGIPDDEDDDWDDDDDDWDGLDDEEDW